MRISAKNLTRKFLIISLVCLALTPSVFAFGSDFIKNNFAKKSATSEIKSVLIKHGRAMEKRDIALIKTFYDEDYKSADGFDIDKLMEMLKKTYDSYEDIKYKTKVNNISTYDNWALVQLSDKSTAKVYPNLKKSAKGEDKKIAKDKVGILEGKSVYNLYLRKNKDSDWKIYRDDVLMEETYLKYGVANKIDMDLITPVFLENGKEYDLSLKMVKPDDIIALGSLSREEITYPPKDYPEKFRKIPQDGELERVVTANDKNLDEYAVASIGFTKVSVNEAQTKARVEVLGMAYILKRINMEKEKKFEDVVQDNVKEVKKHGEAGIIEAVEEDI